MRCGIDCASTDGDALNRRCTCAVVDVGRLRDALTAQLPDAGAVDIAKHANLFSPYALFVDRPALDAMASVAAAVFEVARHPGYIERVLRHAPDIARHDPGSTGGVLGLDFHLSVDGPRLIEINTNPGGLLLNALLLDAAKSCAPPEWMPWTTGAQGREAAVSAWLDDARRQLGRVPNRMPVVDAAPREQFLYPEFELYAQAFRERGIDSAVRAPVDLRWDGATLHDPDGPVDAIYNRLTDFALGEPMCEPLATAYLGGAIALTPHPRAHALFADKRNLEVLGDRRLLEGWGVDVATSERLAQAIPSTVTIDAANRDALWAGRDHYFFKPASGFGSHGSYRGDKMTRRVWDAMGTGPYVAQTFAPPGVRLLHEGASLKADVRCYASESGVLLFAARLYQGQTTNMRTPSGGFAAVLTTRAVAS